MASITFNHKTPLNIGEIHGYAIAALFGAKGFENNFRVFVATRAEITSERTLLWQFDDGIKTKRPRAKLELVISPNQLSYTFDKISLMNQRRAVNGAERYTVFEFSYVDALTFAKADGKAGGGKAAPKGKDAGGDGNPISLKNAAFPTQAVANHCGYTVQLPKQTKTKELLGVEAYQDPQAAAVVRLISHRSYENSWLELLNAQNWQEKDDDRLKWDFQLQGKKVVVSKAVDDQTVVHYQETYGVFNLMPNPVLREYTSAPSLTQHCLAMPFEQIRESSPLAFLHAQHTADDHNKLAGMVQHSTIETVTIKFGQGRYHQFDLG
jgi:hypothetical protein